MRFEYNESTKNVRIYETGGSVRDGLLGLASKDHDFAVIASSFDVMREFIQINGGEIFLETPQYQTIRAKMPELGAADFVLGRHESGYTDGRRPDSVSVASDIEQELSRRDFTVNAMARDCESGDLIDPFGGQRDLATMRLRCVGNTRERMREDALRMLRAVRFSITKGFGIDVELSEFLHDSGNVALLSAVSTERVREELARCFEHDTLQTLLVFARFSHLQNHCFQRLTLKPTIVAKKIDRPLGSAIDLRYSVP